MPKYRKQDTRMKSNNGSFKKYFLGNRGISTVDIIIIIVASIVIIVSGIFLFTNFKTLKQVNEDIAEMKQIIEDKQDTLDRLIELGQSEDALKADYEKNKLYVPDSKDEVGIISDVTDIVVSEGGIFRTITYSEEIIKEDGVTDVPFKVRLDSSYEQLNKIVNKFNRTDRLYIIDSITIIETSTDGSVLNTEIVMHTYYKIQ